ncbi:regulatory protein GemA [Sedimenticola hydrogenitrophicus]|uniref:regulatory protein GemA n=1 Tax=Sedimenticola hydrogenitrophicus TaxID=2967975 RepID=UPI0023B1E4B1|nr:regulatory protein GemA [Sedimenticola hydrogenitrophicus]
MNNPRRTDLAKIHMGAKQLGMDPADKSPDSDYRRMLWTQARVNSSADLDAHGRAKVIAHLRQCGARFSAPRKAGRRPHNYAQLPQYITKVEALLADMGLSWAYADSIARNITGGKGAPAQGKAPGVARLAWVERPEHWRAIVAALVVEQEKRAKHATIQALLGRLGLTEAYVAPWLNGQGYQAKNWHRQRRLMNLIIDHLAERVDACS